MIICEDSCYYIVFHLQNNKYPSSGKFYVFLSKFAVTLRCRNFCCISTMIKTRRAAIHITIIVLACVMVIGLALFGCGAPDKRIDAQASADTRQVATGVTGDAKSLQPALPAKFWEAPDESTIPAGKAGEKIRYGRELLAHTAKYFGPKGSIAKISNGMNCQNCHLSAGSKPFANNYARVMTTYPKLSNRSGNIAYPADRIAECFERSLAGQVPDTAGKEVQAMLAYMKWLGANVKKGQELTGSATERLPYMKTAANPLKGKQVFMNKCQRCHGAGGEGVMAADKATYTYPPLWGKHSYSDGAGMYRIANFAGYVKNNMPLGATYKNPQLTNEEAWNVAAFVNTQPRPHRNQQNDWKNLAKKPIDFPFAPYIDTFTERQHKFGPFAPIKKAQENAK